MNYFLGFFQYISDLGATVMMPIIICIMGVILGAGFGKSLRAGLTVGIGFIGLNLVTGLMGDNLAPAGRAFRLKPFRYRRRLACSGADRVCFNGWYDHHSGLSGS